MLCCPDARTSRTRSRNASRAAAFPNVIRTAPSPLAFLHRMLVGRSSRDPSVGVVDSSSTTTARSTPSKIPLRIKVPRGVGANGNSPMPSTLLPYGRSMRPRSPSKNCPGFWMASCFATPRNRCNRFMRASNSRCSSSRTKRKRPPSWRSTEYTPLCVRLREERVFEPLLRYILASGDEADTPILMVDDAHADLVRL